MNELKKAEIAKILDIQPELLIFEFKINKERKCELALETISPNKHKTKFLFHTSIAESPVAAEDAMVEYVTKHMKDQDTYQIRWHNPKTKEVEVSWFRASNVMEALSKFYHDNKEVAEYKIYEVSLRPYA
jgi:hypothetical protein